MQRAYVKRLINLCQQERVVRVVKIAACELRLHAVRAPVAEMYISSMLVPIPIDPSSSFATVSAMQYGSAFDVSRYPAITSGMRASSMRIESASSRRLRSQRLSAAAHLVRDCAVKRKVRLERPRAAPCVQEPHPGGHGHSIGSRQAPPDDITSSCNMASPITGRSFEHRSRHPGTSEPVACSVDEHASRNPDHGVERHVLRVDSGGSAKQVALREAYRARCADSIRNAAHHAILPDGCFEVPPAEVSCADRRDQAPGSPWTCRPGYPDR